MVLEQIIYPVQFSREGLRDNSLKSNVFFIYFSVKISLTLISRRYFNYITDQFGKFEIMLINTIILGSRESVTLYTRVQSFTKIIQFNAYMSWGSYIVKNKDPKVRAGFKPQTLTN